MAKLTAKARKGLPKGDFAGPGRSFPVEDKKHARLAKSGASRAEHVGNISKAVERRIDQRADRVLGKTKGK
jgi:hypothetical protein